MNRLLALTLLLFSSNTFACIESIEILDGKFEKISTVEDAAVVVGINNIWKNKIVSESKIRINWSNGYKLDIIGDKCGGRWLYHPGGWLMPLAIKGAGLYKIEEYEQFEALLGVAAHNQLLSSSTETMRKLTNKEFELSKWLLENGKDEAQKYLAQLEIAEVTDWKCECGCASINFKIEGLPKAKPGVEILSDYLFGKGELMAGVFIFSKLGVLSGLEVYGFAIDAPPELPNISDLRPMESESNA